MAWRDTVDESGSQASSEARVMYSTWRNALLQRPEGVKHLAAGNAVGPAAGWLLQMVVAVLLHTVLQQPIPQQVNTVSD